MNNEGEWTVEYIENIYRAHTLASDAFRVIASVHNAALAAEREKWEAESDRRDKDEAEYVENMTKELTAQIADRKQLREQLDAELEKHKEAYQKGVEHGRRWEREQLAAEMEKAYRNGVADQIAHEAAEHEKRLSDRRKQL